MMINIDHTRIIMLYCNYSFLSFTLFSVLVVVVSPVEKVELKDVLLRISNPSYEILFVRRHVMDTDITRTMETDIMTFLSFGDVPSHEYFSIF